MSRSRSAARLAAVQALYQQEMEETPRARLIHEFHQHRLGATIEGTTYVKADATLFDDIVIGVDSRREEIDGVVEQHLSADWKLARMDRALKQILRAATYELIARPDMPKGKIISDYVDVAQAFFGARETGFVNGALDSIAAAVRAKG